MRCAIVTGGSRGLGDALCRRLVDDGYDVVEFSRGAPHEYSLKVDCANPHATAETVAARLQSIKPDDCTELLVFSNAGTLSPIGPTSRKEMGSVTESLNVNLLSAIAILTECIRHFRDAKCRKVLVNISSGAAQKGYAGWSLYCAAKAGMEGFIRALAVEEQHMGNSFVAISVDPGVIDTDMQACIRGTSAADFPDVERFIARKANGGLAAPDAVAAAIVDLVSRYDLRSGGRYEVPADG
jgi:benzil reductase ((S)-benzoin forming)